jgi:hypothetical protein
VEATVTKRRSTAEALFTYLTRKLDVGIGIARGIAACPRAET